MPLYVLALILWVFRVSTPAFAEGEPFSVSAPASEVETNEVVNKLRCKVVQDYLRTFLQDNYAKFEKSFKCDQLYEYILDYRKARMPTDRTQIEVTGHLDGESLKRWVRVLQAKLQPTSSPSVAFIVSSQLSVLAFRPRETAQKLKESAFLQNVMKIFSPALQKSSLRIQSSDLGALGLDAPARTQEELKSLHDAFRNTQNATALWIHLTPCGSTSCNGNGVRMEVYFYGLSNQQILIAKGEDLAIEPKELGNSTKVRTLLKPLFVQFQNELDSLVSSGALENHVFDLIVEAVDSYPMFSMLFAQYNQMDFISQVTLSQAEPRVATFEIWSPLSAEEIANRLTASEIGGRKPKVAGVDSRTIRMRY